MIYIEKVLASGKTLILKEAEPGEAKRIIDYLNVVGERVTICYLVKGSFASPLNKKLKSLLII